MPVIGLKCVYCKKKQVESWVEEICLSCKNKKFQYPNSVKMELKDGDYKWRQYGLCCVGKPIIKKTPPKIILLDNINRDTPLSDVVLEPLNPFMDDDLDYLSSLNPFMDNYHPPLPNRPPIHKNKPLTKPPPIPPKRLKHNIKYPEINL